MQDKESERTFIGQYIKGNRYKLMLTQKDLAEKLGVSAQNMNRYEKGVTMPSGMIIYRLWELLDNMED